MGVEMLRSAQHDKVPQRDKVAWYDDAILLPRFRLVNLTPIGVVIQKAPPFVLPGWSYL